MTKLEELKAAYDAAYAAYEADDAAYDDASDAYKAAEAAYDAASAAVYAAYAVARDTARAADAARKDYVTELKTQEENSND